MQILTSNPELALVGFVGTEPEFKMAKNEQFFVTFSLATNDSWKDKEGNWQKQTHWHRISVWGQDMASEVFETIKKGNKVRIEGKLKSHQWTDGEGKTKTFYEIVINHSFGSCLIVPLFKKENTTLAHIEFDNEEQEATHFA